MVRYLHPPVQPSEQMGPRRLLRAVAWILLVLAPIIAMTAGAQLIVDTKTPFWVPMMGFGVTILAVVLAVVMFRASRRT